MALIYRMAIDYAAQNGTLSEVRMQELKMILEELLVLPSDGKSVEREEEGKASG